MFSFLNTITLLPGDRLNGHNSSSFSKHKGLYMKESSEKFVRGSGPWWIWIQGLPSQSRTLEQISFIDYFYWLRSYILFDSNRHMDWHTSKSISKTVREEITQRKEWGIIEWRTLITEQCIQQQTLTVLFRYEWMQMASVISENNQMSHL